MSQMDDLVKSLQGVIPVWLATKVASCTLSPADMEEYGETRSETFSIDESTW